MSFFVYMFAASIGMFGGLYVGRIWEKETSEEKMKTLNAEVKWYRKNSAFNWPGRGEE
uniref:hypothetical protein n=1 Tax=Jeotgalibaca porci TaxID=1868793 RepID=UPI0035A16C43